MEKMITREDAPARAMIAKACGMVGAALTSDAANPEQWLTQTCAQLVDLVEGRAAALACLRSAASFDEALRLLHAGAAGMPSPEAREASLAALAKGDAAPTTGIAGGLGAARALARSQIMSDRVWQASGERRARMAIGLFEFARASAAVDLVDGPGLLTIQLDGLTAQWRPDDLTLAALEAVAPAMARGYLKRFIAPERRKRQLLDRLSDSQKLIAPLLASGLTEREVAERLERSMHTIHEHTREIYRAFGVRSRMELRDLWLGVEAPGPGAGSSVTIRRGSPMARTGSAQEMDE